MGIRVSKLLETDSFDGDYLGGVDSYDCGDSDIESRLASAMNCGKFLYDAEDLFRIHSASTDCTIDTDDTGEERSVTLNHRINSIISSFSLASERDVNQHHSPSLPSIDEGESFERTFTEDDDDNNISEKKIENTKTVESLENDENSHVEWGERCRMSAIEYAYFIAGGVVAFFVLLAFILGITLSGPNQTTFSDPDFLTDNPDTMESSNAFNLNKEYSSEPSLLELTTTSPTTQNGLHIFNILSMHTNIEPIQDKSTPQYKAFNDLVVAEGKYPGLIDDRRILQRYALMSLFYSTGGGISVKSEAWNSMFGWDEFSKTNECSFFGIKRCERTTSGLEVSLLNLDGNNLKGTIPSELCLLSESLEELTLSGNKLTGTIPPCIIDFKFMKKLDLHDNYLDGVLPEGLMHINSLSYVDLSQNDLQGGLDAIFEGVSTDQTMKISQISPALLTFNVSSNRLTGTIPKDLQKLTSLTNLGLFPNQFQEI